MKKVKNLFKNSKTRFILGLILGIILTGGGVYAATIGNSKDVFYDNATSNLSSTNVQDALDELYDKINNRLTTYAFGTPTINSPVDFQEVIASSGSNVFIKKQGSQLSVCLYYNNRLFCMKNGTENWETNKAMLNTTTFPGTTCPSPTSSSSASCYDDSFSCEAYSNGAVCCYDNDAGLFCGVHADGRIECNTPS